MTRMIDQFDIVLCTLSGDYGKPRPCVVIQNSAFNHNVSSSIVVCPITSKVQKEIIFRPTLLPDQDNGLQTISQIMVDKMTAVKYDKVRTVIGVLPMQKQQELIQIIKLWLNLDNI